MLGNIGGIALEDWKPHLVFLNACRSAQDGRSVTLGVLAPLCSKFLARGAQAAIAMQGDIKSVAAGTLAGVFYESLQPGTRSMKRSHRRGRPSRRSSMRSRRAIRL
jgi:CHAT domain-containing protein